MKITLIMLISRQWRLHEMASHIHNIKTRYDLDVLAIVDDTNIPNRYLHDLYDTIPHRLEYTMNTPASEGNIAHRRQRIADNLNISKAMIDHDDYVIILEDDTDITPHTIDRLIHDHLYLTITDHNPGIITTSQAGRHAIQHIGAWHTNHINEPTAIWSTAPNTTLIPVDGTGFYCCTLRADLWRNTPVPNEPYPVGCDAQYGFTLRRKGHTNWIDHRLPVGHTEQNRTIHPTPDAPIITFTKTQSHHWDTQITTLET